MRTEKCELQPYMLSLTYQDAVSKFRLRVNCVETVKTHWKKVPGYEDDLWSCWECPGTALDSTSHISRCRKYADLRTDLDIKSDKDCVLFFQRVIERRLAQPEDEESFKSPY